MKKLCRRGRPQKDSYRPLHVVAVVDDRDAQDGEVCFQFRGANRQLLTRTFDYLIGCGHGIAQRVTVREAHDVIRRIGKNLQRIEVTLHEPNFRFASLSDMKLLIEATLKRLYPCHFQWLNLTKFFNF